MKLLVCILLCALFSLSLAQTVNRRKCRHDYHCPQDQFCTGHVGRIKNGRCVPKPEGWCRDNSQCASGTSCVHIVGHSHGKCEGEHIPSPVEQLPADPKVHLNGQTFKTEEFIVHTPSYVHQISEDDFLSREIVHEEKGSECGCDDMTHPVGKKPKGLFINDDDEEYTESIPKCGSSTCDAPSVRDKYTQTYNKRFGMDFYYFECTKSDFDANARHNIAETMFELNKLYTTAGVKFYATYTRVSCPSRLGDDLKVSYDNVRDLARVALQNKFHQAKGNFVVLVGIPEKTSLNGFAYLPWKGSSASGIVFMNTKVIKRGATTLTHELGHAFGLHHTFAGIDGVNDDGDSCPFCYDSPSAPQSSDLKGDFCSDTPSIPKNWECSKTLSVAQFGRDKCDTSRAQWENNPYENIMSYGNCRSHFSPQQIKRVRCVIDRELKWLKDYNANPPRRCQNMLGHCSSFASYCDKVDYQGYMMKNCPATCGFCSANEVANTPTDTITELTKLAPLPCFDAREQGDCPAFRRLGYCEQISKYYPYMKENCAKTCGECQ